MTNCEWPFGATRIRIPEATAVARPADQRECTNRHSGLLDAVCRGRTVVIDAPRPHDRARAVPVGESGIRTPQTRRVIVAVVLAAGGLLHITPALRYLGGATWLGVLTLVFVVATLAVAALLIRDDQPHLLLLAAVLGAIGVALFLGTRLAPVAGPGGEIASWTEPWALAAFIVDALAVRLAVFTLRLSERAAA